MSPKSEYIPQPEISMHILFKLKNIALPPLMQEEVMLKRREKNIDNDIINTVIVYFYKSFYRGGGHPIVNLCTFKPANKSRSDPFIHLQFKQNLNI